MMAQAPPVGRGTISREESAMVEGRKEAAKWARDIIVTVVLLPALLLWLGMTPLRVIAAGLGALAVIKAWEQGRLAITVAALGLAGAGLGWDWFYSTRFLAPVTAPQAVGPRVLSPAPAPPVRLSEPPKSWVTDEEIAHQRALGRSLTLYSPVQLFQMLEDNQDTKILEGQWIKLDYPVAGIPTLRTVDGKDYYVEHIDLGGVVFSVLGDIYAYFNPKKYGDELLRLQKGQKLRAICQLVGVDRGKALAPFQPRVDTVSAHNCDLL
jgi:hypothetical protein